MCRLLQDRSEGGDLKHKLPAAFFRPPRRRTKTSLDFTSVVGTSSATSWVSWNAESQKTQYVDMALLRHCCRSPDDWARIPQAWLCLAAPGGTLLRRKRGDGKWFFSLSCMGATAVLAWPAAEKVHQGRSYFFLDKNSGLSGFEWLPILELEDYEGMLVEWAGPPGVPASRS